jgi:hypothetical protein
MEKAMEQRATSPSWQKLAGVPTRVWYETYIEWKVAAKARGLRILIISNGWLVAQDSDNTGLGLWSANSRKGYLEFWD